MVKGFLSLFESSATVFDYQQQKETTMLINGKKTENGLVHGSRYDVKNLEGKWIRGVYVESGDSAIFNVDGGGYLYPSDIDEVMSAVSQGVVVPTCTPKKHNKADDRLLLETINKKSVTVFSGPDPEFDGRSMVLISGDKHDMEDLHKFLIEN